MAKITAFETGWCTHISCIALKGAGLKVCKFPARAWLLDVGDKVAQQYGVRGIPTTVILNRNGQEVFRKVGGTTSQELEKVLKGLEQ